MRLIHDKLFELEASAVEGNLNKLGCYSFQIVKTTHLKTTMDKPHKSKDMKETNSFCNECYVKLVEEPFHTFYLQEDDS